MNTHYKALVPIRFVLSGKLVQIEKDEIITATQWRKLPSCSMQDRFVGTAKPRREADSDALVPIQAIVDALNKVTAEGCILHGNYKTVYTTLGLNVIAPWAGYRGNHLAEAGRRWEETHRRSFEELCPDLRGTGSEWVSNYN